MSFIFFVGPPVWFKWECSNDFVRLSFGPFGFWILFQDFELFLGKVVKALDRQWKAGIEKGRKLADAQQATNKGDTNGK